jgi:hypothetical protein
MRIIANILVVLVFAMGVIWILQGVNILPGSFMTGQMVWARRGAAVAVFAVLLLIMVNRKRRGIR